MAIVCDLCGGSSFVKEGDFYVCQGCGTKYSLEEAKRMLTSEASASNKNAENAVLNYMTLGQNAIKAGNLSEAESYANKALEVDSLNPEAWILKGRSVGWQSTLQVSRVDEALNHFLCAINYASDDTKMSAAEHGYRELYGMGVAIIDLRGKDYVENVVIEGGGFIERDGVSSKISGYGRLLRDSINKFISQRAQFMLHCSENGAGQFLVDHPNLDSGLAARINGYVEQTYSKVCRMKHENTFLFADDIFLFCIDALDILDATDPIEDESAAKIRILKNKINYIDSALRNFNRQDDSFLREARTQYQKELKDLDPGYQETQAPATTKPASNSGGCYVATAVYGSYDCPEVWTLRRYRDYTLAETWYGRMFVYVYYAISPTLVKWFGDTNWFKNIWRPTLDRMVKRLNNDGVADTPYQDRSW